MTTNKRAIEILKNELACVDNPDCNREECRNCQLVMQEHEITGALHMAIEALEQEPVLDKIRAEIIKYEGDCRLSVDEYPSCKQCTDSVLETIYGILDKYTAESEDKE